MIEEWVDLERGRQARGGKGERDGERDNGALFTAIGLVSPLVHDGSISKLSTCR